MTNFWDLYSEAALTSLSFFWKALWAFILGYIISSLIQILVTRDRMQETMGTAGSNSVAIGTFFGFISSSCSFSALATTKALFAKGAGFVPAMAFLLASTNLVVELGMIIAVFLGWQFVVGEYVGGLLLILFMWLGYRLTHPKKMILNARRRLQENEGEGQSKKSRSTSWKTKLKNRQTWQKIAKKYFMEWGMVWKDVTVGFTIAGIIVAFVPTAFFETLFIGSGQGSDISFLAVLENIVIGPIAAFFTFIGSMGNIPLAAVLYGNGVSFGGVMAFIFSDLVVFPVIRVNAKYYGWKMALYILGLLFGALIMTALLLHYGFDALGMLPENTGGNQSEGDRFAIDYTFFLNIIFLGITGLFVWLRTTAKSASGGHHHDHHDHDHNHGDDRSIVETVLLWLAIASYIWLAGGCLAALLS